MKLAILFTGLGLAVLSGCTGVPVINNTYVDKYVPTSNALFLGNGQLVLLGETASPEEHLQIAQIAADNIAAGAFGGKFQLVPVELANSPSRNRVVVVLGGAFGYTLCSDPPASGGRFGGSAIYVTAAACNGDRHLSSTSGYVNEIDGANDPAVARLFQQVGAQLFPGRNLDYELPDRQGEFDQF